MTYDHASCGAKASNFEQVPVQQVFVAHAIVVSETLHQTCIGVKDQFFEGTPLVCGQEAFFRHFGDDSE